MITEPDVTLTDFLLAAECFLFVFLLLKYGKQSRALRVWFVFFFAATGLSALFGGLVHGFFLDEASIGYQTLWPATIIGLGVAALSGWLIGAHLLLNPKHIRTLGMVAGVSFAFYCAVVLSYSQTFGVAVAYYLPAALFMLGAFILVYRHTGHNRSLSAIVGFILSFIAAGVQQGKIGLHPIYFNHNAFYHLIQAVALFLIFRAALWLVTMEPPWNRVSLGDKRK